MLEIISLCIFAFLAGLIDSMVGGGGLIQLPALFIFLPHTAPAAIFGTNKLSSITGTFAATISYLKEVSINWSIVIPSAITALIFSALGAKTVSLISSEVLRPLLLILLIFVAIYTFNKKDFGSLHAPKHKGNRAIIYAILIAAVLGFYDGFFGPGTGSFLIFLYIGVLGFDFIRASTTAKIINLSTNISALIYFAAHGQVLYHLAIPMAICNAMGGTLGAKLAIKKGSAFVRVFFLGIVSVLIVKFAYDIFQAYFE